jgi:beta-glucanase (GH16 family)
MPLPVMCRIVALLQNRIVSWCALLFSTLALHAQEPAWSLVWADEFDGADGSAPDVSRWSYDLGGNGWGNNELQTYTDRRTNSWIENGRLVITARKEPFAGSDNRRREYTSARLKTQGRFSWTYGRFEARMKLPRGQGIWPAFWMLGTNITSAGWPACGEIDILENIGREPRTIHGTVHGPGYSGGDGIGRETSLPDDAEFANDFHLYAVEWTTNRIRWSLDNRVYFTVTPASLPAGRTWVFNAPQFLLLNLAVGGNWPGNPDATTLFPQRYEIDYVRVYAATNVPAPKVQAMVRDGLPAVAWADAFPQARLEHAPVLPPVWREVALTGRIRSGLFEEQAGPGFYRLRWTR